MRLYVYFLTVVFLFSGACVQAAPGFGDLAVLLAKGYFKGPVSSDATLEECVAFLNKQGVCFSLFDLVDPNAEVHKEDFARVIGQSTLLFFGEAEIEQGCIGCPEEVTSWVDYCLLNDVDLLSLWSGFLLRMEKGTLPEVRNFYKRAP